MSKKLTRKDFLTNTSKYAIGAVAGVAGLNVLSGGKLMAKTCLLVEIFFVTFLIEAFQQRGWFDTEGIDVLPQG